jgi:hypothetical protein
MKAERPPESGAESLPHFVHSKLDDYGLTAAQFRVHGTVARRGGCTASLETIANTSRLNRDTVIDCLRFLVERRLLSKESRPGRPSVYRQNPVFLWIPAGNEGAPETRGHLPNSGTGWRKAVGTHLPETKGHKGSPVQGNPLKEKCNGVAVAPPRPSLIGLWQEATPDGKRVIERLRKLIPDADQNAGYWKALLEGGAASVSAGLDALWARLQNDTLPPVENCGGWLTDWIKHENGEHENQY